VSETSSDNSFYINLPKWLAYADWFRKAIDYLESEDCTSGDLAAEARKKIGEAVELMAAAVEDNDKDKQEKAKNLIHEVMQAFFSMLDYCYNKYAGPRMRQSSQGGGKA